MWIEPNGVVKIIQNVDLDNKYENTIYFANRTAQYNYFNSKVKYTYPKITYQRIKRNYMRVEINAENLYDCNYLMFQNTSFGNRWFYAFIKKVEYVANMVSEIEYEIDVMQTWFLNGNANPNTSDCTMSKSFVERQHSYTDAIGENLVHENLELGDYVSNGFGHSSVPEISGDPVLVIAATVYIKSGESTYTKYEGDYQNGVFSGLYYHIFRFTTQGVLNLRDFINDVIADTGSTDAIVDAFMVPEIFIPDHLNRSDRFIPATAQYSFAKPYTSIDGYTPRNKKLFTHPYNLLEVIDVHGNEGVYQYEYFTGNNVQFEYSASTTCDPSMMIAPLNYKGVAKNYNEKMVYKGFPHCSLDTDFWKAYLSQNGGTLMGTLGLPLASALIGASGYSALEGVALISGFNSVFNSVKEVRNSYIQGPQAKGNYNGDVIFSDGVKDFYYNKLSVRREYAEIIDDYFDMYGYATKRVIVPNINSRPQWNYVKTIGANIFGNIPADDLKLIKDIFDSGITFWKNGDNIGNYSLDNRPV